MLWGSATVDARGREVKQFINNHNINIMNNGAPTRISYDTETAIDLHCVHRTWELICIGESPRHRGTVTIVRYLYRMKRPSREMTQRKRDGR